MTLEPGDAARKDPFNLGRCSKSTALGRRNKRRASFPQDHRARGLDLGLSAAQAH